MIKNWRGYYYRALVSLITILCLFILFSTSSHGRTVVEKTGQCSIRVTIKIEIWGPMASQAVIDRWKDKIESQWNGPTKETMENIAINDGALGTGEFGYTPLTPGMTPAQREATTKRNNDNMRIFQEKLLAKHKEMMDAMGMEGSNAIVNCCTITFVADVRMRADDAEPTDDYHQIKVVEKYKEVEVGGKTVKKQVRSYVNRELIDGKYVRNGQNRSTSGQWAFDPRPEATGWDASSHEVGHLMQLGDQYHDHDHDGDGEVESVDVPGQEANVMANNNGFPHESDLKSIIDQAGIECDCCPNEEQTDRYYVQLGRTTSAMGNAIGACNLDQINQGINDLNDQMKNMGQSRLPTATKLDLYRKIKAELDRLNKAKKDCSDPVEETTETSMGDDMSTYGLDDFALDGRLGLGNLKWGLGTDSTEFCTYAGGNEDTYIEPPTMTIDPPGGTVDDPDSTPNPQPQPGTTPGGTPGSTPGSTPGMTIPTPDEIFSDGFESGDTSSWYEGPTANPPGGTIQGPGVTPTEDGGGVFVPSGPKMEVPIRIRYGDLEIEIPVPLDTAQPEEETPTEETTPEETPEEDKPQTVTPTVVYHMKAKDSVTQGDGTKLSQNMGGQRIKLIDPSLQSPQLAMTDNEKTDVGYDASPTQCTTDDLGECDIQVNVKDLLNSLPNVTPGGAPTDQPTITLRGTPAQGGGTPANGLTGEDAVAYGLNPDGTLPIAEINVEVAANKVNSQNMIVPNDQVETLPEEVTNSAGSKLTVGDNTYYTFTSGYSMGMEYNWGVDLKMKYDLQWEVEENICGDEQPGPPMGTFIDTLGLAQGNDIPNAKISIPVGGIQ